MKNRTIHTVIILGILSLVTILTVQLLWMEKTIRIQETNIAIQAKADSLNLKEFTQQVEVSLKKVLKQILLTLEVVAAQLIHVLLTSVFVTLALVHQ